MSASSSASPTNIISAPVRTAKPAWRQINISAKNAKQLETTSLGARGIVHDGLRAAQ